MVNTRFMSRFGGLLLSAALVACGGGGQIGSGSGGTLGGTAGGTTGGVVPGPATSLVVTTAQPSIVADGTSTTTVTATLTDSAGVPVPAMTINFAATAGTLSAASAVTGVNGTASVTLRAGTLLGTSTITARDATTNILGTTSISFSSGVVSSVQLTSSSGVALPGDTVTVTALALDQNGNPVQGEGVSFSASPNASGGQFEQATTLTDANGRAVNNYVAGTAFGQDTLRVLTAGGLTNSVALTVAPPNNLASSLTLLASSPQLASDADDVTEGVTLTAIVKDINNNVLPGVTVVFSTADSAELNVVNPAVTDSNGRVQATLTTGGDPQNRTIVVAASAGVLLKTQAIDVFGTRLEVTGPEFVQFNVPSQYIALLTDAAGAPVAGRTVQFSASAGSSVTPAVATTNASGIVTVQLTAQTSPSTLTATALGLTAATDAITVSTDNFSFSSLPSTSAGPETISIDGAAQPVQVRWLRNGSPLVGAEVRFALTRGQIEGSPVALTDAGGYAEVNIASTQAGFSTIAASGVSIGSPSTTAAVEFVATIPFRVTVQASPSTVAASQSSDISAVVRDVNNNLVKNQVVEFSLSDLTTGTLSAPTAVTNSQGLALVTYTAGPLNSATQGVTVTGTISGTAVTDSEHLTVGGRPASIVIGTGSEIIIKDESTYQDPFTVLVADSAGNPAPDATFRLSVRSVGYFEGTFGDLSVECLNEDLNDNDILEANLGEDLNGNGRLDPARVATIDSTITLDPDGSGQFFLTYPKDRGGFVNVEITGIATVSGTETTAKRTIVLRIAEEDVDNLPGVSPYGVDKNCATPN